MTARASHTIEGARHGPVLPMRIPEHRDSSASSPAWLQALKTRLRLGRLDPSFRADARIQTLGLVTNLWLVVSLRLGVGDGRRSDSEGRAAGAGGSSGATEPSPNGSAPRGCVVHKPERARAEQREQHGRRGASRHGAKRVLVPADLNLIPHILPVRLTDAREDGGLFGMRFRVNAGRGFQPSAPRL